MRTLSHGFIVGQGHVDDELIIKTPMNVDLDVFVRKLAEALVGLNDCC